MKTFNSFFSKTTFIISTFFLFSTVILYNSCDKPRNENDYITQSDIDLMKENHIISLQKAVNMYKKYDKERIKILKDTLEKKYKDPKFNDTRMVWLDIKTMKAYIKHVEDESSKVGIDPEGLQFYFGVNSDKEPGKKKNHQTFFVAPTTKKDSVQFGYTLEYKDDKVSVLFLKDAINNRGNQTQQSSRTDKAGFFSTALDNHHHDGLLLNRVGGTPPGGNQ